MCGLLGFVDSPWADRAEVALAAIAARGPDDQGWFRDPGVVLGHRRLSIIDLAGGHQPMLTATRRHVIVFNGEIYNYRELRDELRALGHVFTTDSDTEVLLAGYVQWGRDMLAKLDGMFAFAIWDTVARRLFAARDRMGVKPFMYSTERGFIFASTLAPFLAIPEFAARIDYEGLRDYLAFQTVVAPHTLVRGVRQLLPAHWLEYDAACGALAQGQYWSIPAPADHAAEHVDRGALIERVDQALARSVRRQLIADVPLGAFLSGGIDSSLMVHYMAQAGARPLRTFSVRFASAQFDETQHARTVAAHYGTEHQVLDAPAIDGAGFAATLDALDQPLGDPAYVPTAALSRLTRSGVTVAISGDGGDELFGGYPRFLDQERDHPRRAWQPLLAGLIRAGIAPGALVRRSLAGRDLLLYRKVDLGPYPRSRKSMRDYLTAAAWDAAKPDRVMHRWLALADSYGRGLDTASLMRADLWTYLSENCLVKTDRASMAASLEVRVPMLGNDVLDAVLTLPAAAHFDPRFESRSEPQGKALLRALAQRHLPESVWNRPKHGFSVPLRDYLGGPWRAVCESWIAAAPACAPFLDQRALVALWRAVQAGRGSVRLAYSFIVLLAWLSKNRVTA